jgi:hypothetical protein
MKPPEAALRELVLPRRDKAGKDLAAAQQLSAHGKRFREIAPSIDGRRPGSS